MIHYVKFGSDNVSVVAEGTAADVPDGCVEVPMGTPLLNHYLVDDVFVPRPVAPVPLAVTGGWEVIATEGTQFVIWDMISMTIIHDTVDSSFEFGFTDSGTYKIVVTPPLPYVRSETTLEVSV